MADRRVRLILEAQIAGFKRSMDEASRATEGLKESTEQLGRTPLRQQAREIGQEWSRTARTMQSDMRTVGTGYAAIGASIMGVYGALVNTGVQYNSLQQVAGRSLETMTGSASDAADQMDRLDEFASTSPFFRQTWLEAQRQLMAFGMEAEDVVPTLDGIQEAVAAIGGGDAEIMRLVDILGQIQGQGQITGRELQRMGQMGIDAASIMGDQMGMTGNEIREQITSGAIDAETAIAALTAGMSERFEGSADSIRDTMDGAWADLQAAWRDLGSVLAEPLVGADGGGMLVELTNSASDLLRTIQEIPGPVLQVVGAISGLAGVAAAGYGAMMLLVPQVVAFRDAKRRLAEEMPRTNAAMGTLSRVARLASIGLLAASVAGAALGRSLDDIGDVDAFSQGIRRLGDSSQESAARIDELSTASLGIGGEIRDLQHAFDAADTGGFERAIKSPLGAMGLLNDEMDAGELILQNYDSALANLVRDGNLEAAAEGFQHAAREAGEAGWTVSEVAAEFTDLEAALYAADISMEEFMLATGRASQVFSDTDVTLEELVERMNETEDGADELADSSAELEDALAGVGVTADGVIDSMYEFLDVLYQTGLLTMSARDAQARYESQLDSVDESVKQLKDSIVDEYIEKGYSAERARELAQEQIDLGHVLNDNADDFDLTTEAGRNAQDQFHDTMRAGMDLTEALAENGATQDEVQAALQRTYDDTIAAGVAFGMTEEDAEALTREILGIPDNVDIETWMSDEAKRVADETAASLDAIDGRHTTSTHTHTVNQRVNEEVRQWSERQGWDSAPQLYNSGGPVVGPGTGTSDSILARLSNGEHVLTARDVQAMGGQQSVYAMRRSLHQPPSARYMVPTYASGGAVGARQITEALQGIGSAGINLGGMNFQGVTPEIVERGVTRAVFRELQSQGVPVAVPA